MLPRRRSAVSPLALFFLAAGATALFGSCSSARQAKEPSLEKTELELHPIRDRPPEPIGKFLADIDLTLRRWNSLMLTAKSADEQRQARLIQGTLERATKERLGELVEQLESGPPQNRIRAATALGFTHDPQAQSPLLSALADSSSDVVHNALLGLALLERADTPLEPICAILSSSRDPETRSNAAYALRSIVAAGGSGDCALTTARLALVDAEPFVRVQAALVLGVLHDTASIEPLGDGIYDTIPLVSQGAAQALVLIGKAVPTERGRVARILALALTRVDSKRELDLRRALIRLADVDYGDDHEEWLRWSQRLP